MPLVDTSSSGLEWRIWVPTYTGFSVDPSSGLCRYAVLGTTVFLAHKRIAGTSNATTFTITLPINALNTSSFAGIAQDGGTVQTLPGLAQPFAVSNDKMSCFKTLISGAWTNTGAKNLEFSLFYEIAV